ncbi:hypothetical protein BH11MYX2_BH11MYX2_19960 [soil metagenome]
MAAIVAATSSENAAATTRQVEAVSPRRAAIPESSAHGPTCWIFPFGPAKPLCYLSITMWYLGSVPHQPDVA